MKKRIISLVLSLSVVATMNGTTVYAAESLNQPQEETDAVVSETEVEETVGEEKEEVVTEEVVTEEVENEVSDREEAELKADEQKQAVEEVEEEAQSTDSVAEINTDNATSYTEGDFVYEDSSKKVLTGYTGTSTSITIPSTVISIGSYAFSDNTTIQSVEIPASVQTIEEEAFSGCKELEKVTLNEGLTSIGRYAFEGCSSLQSISIPKNVTEIGGWAFKQCTGLTNVTLAYGVKKIGNCAFVDCSGITSITIPATVTSLGWGAFARCTGIEKAVIGTYSSTKNTYVTSLKEIQFDAFKNCNNLSELVLGDGIKIIGEAAFYNTGITTLNLPSSVTDICRQAFADNEALKTANLGNGVTIIGHQAFEWCSALETVTIPASVTAIGILILDYCDKAVVQCYEGSKAHTYAKRNNYNYELLLGDVSNLTAASYGKNKVRLTWGKASDAEGYLIYAQKNGKYAYCGMTSNTSYVDAKALEDNYNFYWVFPYRYKSDGSMQVGTANKYVYAKGILPAVTSLKASSVTGGVELTWGKVTDADGYLVYGKRGADGTYSYIGMTGSTGYTDKKALKSDYNYYWVTPYYKDANGKMVAGVTAEYVYGKAK